MADLSAATISELWRFPVKSMGGEQVQAATVDGSGLLGDRGYALVDVDTGRVASAKLPRAWGSLLQCQARYVEEPAAGAPLPAVAIDLGGGRSARSDDPDVDAQLSAHLGRSVRLTTVAPDGAGYLAVWPQIEGVLPEDMRASGIGEEADGTLTDLPVGLAVPGSFFDVAALHVVTTSTLRHLGEVAPASRFAVERYRPNAVIDVDAAPFVENGWTGATAQLGSAVTASVMMPTMRCIMTTLAQGDLPRDPGVLQAVAQHNRIELPGLGTWSCVGAYASVLTGGRVAVGDAVAVRA